MQLKFWQKNLLMQLSILKTWGFPSTELPMAKSTKEDLVATPVTTEKPRLEEAATQLTAPVTNTFGGSAAFLAGQTGSINFQTFGVQAAPGGNEAPGTTVFAGTYQDTVTITVTAN